MLLFLKNLAFTLVVPSTVAGYVPWLIIHSQPPAPLGRLVPSSILFAVGGMIYLWCLWDFASFGRGTPAPMDAPRRLVVRGLYQYSRNPMYVGVVTVIAGWNVLTPAVTLLVYSLCVATGFQLFIVLYEEPHLRRHFGVQYEEYCSRVGRWITVPSRARPPSSRG